MNTTSQDVMLWGHSYADYLKMFGLDKTILKQPILDCSGGASSFNAELTQKGGQVISTDAMYHLSKKKLKQKIEIDFDSMLKKLDQHQEQFIWDSYGSFKKFVEARKKNIELFLADYEQGVKGGRYKSEMPPDLPFEHFEFELALASHYFFSYSLNQDVDFHVTAITNLCDVAKELRIFPLIDSNGAIPVILGPVTQALQQATMGVEIKAVPYQFQEKGNAMLRVWAQTCEV